jgi:fumarate reductase subunit D
MFYVAGIITQFVLVLYTEFRLEVAAFPASLLGRVISFIFIVLPFGCAPDQRITRRRKGGDVSVLYTRDLQVIR